MTTRQKKLIRLTLLVFFSSVMVVAGFLVIQWIGQRKVKFRRYPEFGIAIPEKYSIHGIDVSKYQSQIEWSEVQSMKVKEVKLGFTYIKATEGIGNSDPQFRRNWKKSKEAGLFRGAYHFFIASKDGKLQAENYINKVDLEPGDLPPVLDIEQLNGTTSDQLRKEAKEWLEVVENYYHTKPVIYTNVDFYNKYLGKDFDQYPLWVAHYYQPHKPRIKRDWILWQHSSEGTVNGITSRVDFNVFNGDSLEFQSFVIK